MTPFPLDTGYMTAFLMMYRTFTSSDELLDQLIQRFFIEPPPQLSNEDLRIWQEKKQTPVRLR